MNKVAVSAITTTKVSILTKPGFKMPMSATSPINTRKGALVRIHGPRESQFAAVAVSVRILLIRSLHHVTDELDLRGLGARWCLKSRRDLSVAHDQDRVRQSDRFFQGVSCENYRYSALRKIANQLIDLFLGTDIKPAGRVIKDQDSGARMHLLTKNNLLRFAAAEIQTERVDICRSDSEFFDPTPRQLPFAEWID